MTHLLPPDGRPNVLSPNDRICMPSQQAPNKTDGSPSLVAGPGDQVLLCYQEKGHVTLPHITPGKPSPGTFYVYGTGKSMPTDTLLTIHQVWNRSGSGGDRRGRLLTHGGFDDGQCYSPTNSTIARQKAKQFNADPQQGPNRWCHIVVQLSHDVRGSYTLYWVWDWPTVKGVDGLPSGKIEIYTTGIYITVLEGDAD